MCLVIGVSSIVNTKARFFFLLVMGFVFLTLCRKLRNKSLKAIGEKCPGLCAIDLSKCNLTDSSLAYLASGCRSIQRLKLSCNSFRSVIMIYCRECCIIILR